MVDTVIVDKQQHKQDHIGFKIDKIIENNSAILSKTIMTKYVPLK
jgi:hypothetical protein